MAIETKYNIGDEIKSLRNNEFLTLWIIAIDFVM